MTRYWRLLASLAVQNVGRRKARTALLATAVAVSCAAAFSGSVLLRSITASMSVGFSRMGADLMVAPGNALINITAGLLTVEPTDQTVPADLFAKPIAGADRIAPQRLFRTVQSGLGGHGESVDLIGFDRASDFTVQPWIAERLGRQMKPGDVIIGGARDVPIGSEIVLFGRPSLIYAKLGRSRVGTHERGLFMTMDDLLGLACGRLSHSPVTLHFSLPRSALWAAVLPRRSPRLAALRLLHRAELTDKAEAAAHLTDANSGCRGVAGC